MILIFAASEVVESSSSQGILAISLFILMALIILAFGVFVGIKAFRSTRKDD